MFALAMGLSFAAAACAQSFTIPDDSTAPLRRFPFSILVKRPGEGDSPVSVLHVPFLRPKDQMLVKVGDKSTQDWTFVEAFVGAAQKIEIKSWDLWDKKLQGKEIPLGALPDQDVVPLFFLVLNKGRDRRVGDAIRHSLQIASEQIISDSAAFQTAYDQQNRLYDFLSAYGALGPKQTADPVTLQQHIESIDADLGVNYNPYADSTQAGDFQKALDAVAGTLRTLRQTPDNPVASAQLTQSQLPAVVSDWVSLVGDLVHIFFRPPKAIKLTFIPASASKQDDVAGDEDDAMDLLTQRVCETNDGSLPALVYRPLFARRWKELEQPLAFEKSQVLADDHVIEIPLALKSRDLFLHPWAWDWEISLDGGAFAPAEGATLVPGRGLVIPISSAWWGSDDSRILQIRARIGFGWCAPVEVKVGRYQPQDWSLQQQPDLACGANDSSVQLARSGKAQPFYDFQAVVLTDSSGKDYKASDIRFGGGLDARFDLSGAAPGPAQIKVYEDVDDGVSAPISVFVQPHDPDVDFFCGSGDSVLRIAGANASWVQSVAIPSLTVRAVDDSQPGNRLWTMSGPIPAQEKSLTVTYKDPATGLTWTRQEPLTIGQPRPKLTAVLIGTIPESTDIGAGSDPSWAVATMPSGWFDILMPVRVQLEAIAPFSWTHDVSMELGLGSAGDVETAATIPEGSELAIDERSVKAILTFSFTANLPANAARSTGVVWVRATRSELSSPWIVATDATGAALRAVRVPTVQSVENTPGGTKITFANVQDLIGIKFPGQTSFSPLQLEQVTPQSMEAVATGPANATEFDLQMQDASDGAIHVKIVKAKPG